MAHNTAWSSAICTGANLCSNNPCNPQVAATKEWTTLGYLHTNYGRRPLPEVLAQIDNWLMPGAGGFGDLVQGARCGLALGVEGLCRGLPGRLQAHALPHP
jgi:hypothetical protein